MKVPINWLENYIKLEHSHKEFGDIMTKLEFMQDGPIKEVNGEPVIDLEVRQNRPDVLSVIGAAQEYAAYINKKVKYPKQDNNIKIEDTEVKHLIKVEAEGIVKRFTAVVIRNINVKKSSKEMERYLQAYGISPINNIVDITNYVMLEYGIPMHAFDLDKLPQPYAEDTDLPSLLTLKMAENDENFVTWQGTKVDLTKNDLVVVDANNRLVSIGGITGESASGISENTKNILLESANYDHASVRKTSLTQGLITDSALRHSKFLPSEMVEIAIRRGVQLIKKQAGGEVKEIEDYYPVKEKQRTIEFNTKEVERLGGKKIEVSKIISLLKRLGFKIKEEKIQDTEYSVLHTTVPKWRTDITYEEDLVEEVWRLHGYDKIPIKEISMAPPKNITPKDLILEDKIRDILLSLKFDEQITEPLIKSSNIKQQIKIQNPLNTEKDALRTSIKQTLKPVLQNYKKANKEKVKIFEAGKIYYELLDNDTEKRFKEEKRIQALYQEYSPKEVKADLLCLLNKLGLFNPTFKQERRYSLYFKGSKIAILENNAFELYTENLLNIIDIRNIPYLNFQTGFIQTIEDKITYTVNNTVEDKIAKIIIDSSKYITNVYVEDLKRDIYKKDNVKRTTFTVVFKDAKNELTRDKVEKIRNRFNKKLKEDLEVSVYKG